MALRVAIPAVPLNPVCRARSQTKEEPHQWLTFSSKSGEGELVKTFLLPEEQGRRLLSAVPRPLEADEKAAVAGR